MNFKIYTRAIILNKNNDILVLKKRSDQKIWWWDWLLPGWTVEFWEDLENALAREILEETNLKIVNISFFAHQKIILADTHWLGIYFVCDAENWENMQNQEPEKHEKLQLFSRENLPKMHDATIIEKFFTQ